MKRILILLASLVFLIALSENVSATTYLTDCGTLSTPGETYVLINNVNVTYSGTCFMIDANGVTLDGNGYTITGSGPGYGYLGYGVYLSGKTGVTIKNLNIRRFTFGIFLYSSNSNNLLNNIVSSNDFGIFLNSSNSNTLTNNTANSNLYGISLWPSSDSNTLTNNNASSNGAYGILLSHSSSNTLINNTANSNPGGISLGSSSNSNTLTNNTANSNASGITLSFSSNNTVTNNNANFNIWNGITLMNSSNDNTLTYNTANSNGTGINLYSSSNNEVYNNHFVNNPVQAYVSGGNGNIFNLPSPIGGNYWSDFDTPAEGCNDENNDGFCDAPYTFSGGADYLPLTTQIGWLDSDGDGILNVDDLCDFENAAGFDADLNGCIDTLTGLPQVIEALPSEVLSDEIKNSLVSKVNNALNSVDKEVINAAINQLQAFINEIEAQRGKNISEEVADMLIEYAQNIITQLQTQL